RITHAEHATGVGAVHGDFLTTGQTHVGHKALLTTYQGTFEEGLFKSHGGCPFQEILRKYSARAAQTKLEGPSSRHLCAAARQLRVIQATGATRSASADLCPRSDVE